MVEEEEEEELSQDVRKEDEVMIEEDDDDDESPNKRRGKRGEGSSNAEDTEHSELHEAAAAKRDEARREELISSAQTLLGQVSKLNPAPPSESDNEADLDASTVTDATASSPANQALVARLVKSRLAWKRQAAEAALLIKKLESALAALVREQQLALYDE